MNRVNYRGEAELENQIIAFPQKRRKKKHRSLVKFGTVSLAIAITSCAFYYFIQKKNETFVVSKNFQAVMKDVEQDSSLDEVLKEQDFSVEQVTLLETAIEQAKAFDRLEIDEQALNTKVVPEQMEYDLEKVQTIYEEAKALENQIDGKFDTLSIETEKYFESLGKFLGAEDAVNTYLSENAYQVYSDLGLSIAYSKLLDAYDFPVEKLNNFSLQPIDKLGDPISIQYVEPTSKKSFIVKSLHTYMIENQAYKMLSNIYLLQTENRKVQKLSEAEKTVFNPDRMELLEEAKNILYSNCYCDYAITENQHLKCDTSAKELQKKLIKTEKKK